MALIQACKDGNVEAVKALLAQGAEVNPAVNPNAPVTAPLDVAAIYNHLEVARLLVAAGAQADSDDEIYTALHNAARHGNVKLCALLLEHGAAVDGSHSVAKTSTPLTDAAMGCKTDVVHLLLAHGANVEGVKTRSRPLHYALQSPNGVEVVKALLEAGADANALDSNGKTPLQLLARFKPQHDQDTNAANIEVLKLLLAAGAKHEQCGFIGTYALQLEGRVAQLEAELKMWRSMPLALTEAIVGVAHHIQSYQ